MEDGGPLYQDERFCEECGERFWGTAGARFCSSACRSRRWRAKRAKARCVELGELCEEVLQRRNRSSAAYSKLLPRLFRQVAVELRRMGWDPIELLMNAPDEAASQGDGADGGTEGVWPERRRWLHPPEREATLLEAEIGRRLETGRTADWHQSRLAQLRRLLAKRGS